jgi:hypothetical protein
MTTVLYVDPAAFTGGGPLVSMAAARSKVRIPVGQTDRMSNINGAGIGIQYSTPELQAAAARNGVTITCQPVTVDDVQVSRWSQFMKNSLADLVRRGYIIMEQPAGAPLTPASIISL